jgi:hypothetical protein
MQEKAIDVSIKQRNLETALSNAGLLGMAEAMAARATAQRQHTATFASLTRFESALRTTQAAATKLVLYTGA